MSLIARDHASFSPVVLSALLIGLCLRILFAVLTPVGDSGSAGRLCSYNDEQAHVNYVLHVLRTGSLPGQLESIQERGGLERAHFENYQPPLFYLLCAGLCRLLGLEGLQAVTLAARLFNVVLWCALVLVAGHVFSVLELSALAAQGAVVFVALSGVLVRFSSTVTNDVLFWIAAGMMLHQALRMERDGISLKNAVLFTLVAVIALYTKLSALLLLPLPAVALGGKASKRACWIAVAACAAVIVCTLPVWWRNVRDFGSLIPLAAGFGPPTWRLPGLASMAYAARSLVFPWAEFWSGTVGLLFLLPAAAWFVAGGVSFDWRLLPVRRVALAALLITAASYIALNVRYDQAEARYLFAAWPLLAVAFGVGLRRRWHWVMLLFAMLLPYGLMIIPRHG